MASYRGSVAGAARGFRCWGELVSSEEGRRKGFRRCRKTRAAGCHRDFGNITNRRGKVTESVFRVPHGCRGKSVEGRKDAALHREWRQQSERLRRTHGHARCVGKTRSANQRDYSRLCGLSDARHDGASASGIRATASDRCDGRLSSSALAAWPKHLPRWHSDGSGSSARCGRGDSLHPRWRSAAQHASYSPPFFQ